VFISDLSISLKNHETRDCIDLYDKIYHLKQLQEHNAKLFKKGDLHKFKFCDQFKQKEGRYSTSPYQDPDPQIRIEHDVKHIYSQCLIHRTLAIRHVFKTIKVDVLHRFG